MPAIQELTRKVYFSPTRGRSFMSKPAAIKAEAAALIKQRYATEQPEYEDGHCTYSGFHWTSLPRQDVLFRRVCRLVKGQPDTTESGK